MPRVHVEDPVPYDQSRVWRLQDVYFGARGLLAWEAGDIPFGATSNPIIARQHAAFLAAMLPAGPVTVVELGGGNGLFALAFLKALATARAPAIRALAARVTYVLTDMLAGNLATLAKTAPFDRYVADGKLILATCDLRVQGRPAAPAAVKSEMPQRQRAPELDSVQAKRVQGRPAAPAAVEFRDLDGRPLGVSPTVVIANYLMCVTPTKILHKSPLGWLERYVRLGFEADDELSPEVAWDRLREGALKADAIAGATLDTTWVPTDPEQALAKAQAGGTREVLHTVGEGTVAVPYLMLDVIERVVRDHGAWVLVTDFGRPSVEEMRGAQLHDPVMYGQCMSHPVDFPLLDAWGAHAEIDVLRTVDPLKSVFVAAMRPMSDDQERMVRAFWRVYGNRDAEDFFDLQVALRHAYDSKDWPRAARIARRALNTDPDNVDLLHRFGTAMISAGHPHLGVFALRRGRKLAPDGVLDFDFALGRAFLDARDHARAVRALLRSLKHGETPVALVDLGRAYRALGQQKKANACFDRALGLAPEDAYAKKWHATT